MREWQSSRYTSDATFIVITTALTSSASRVPEFYLQNVVFFELQKKGCAKKTWKWNCFMSGLMLVEEYHIRWMDLADHNTRYSPNTHSSLGTYRFEPLHDSWRRPKRRVCKNAAIMNMWDKKKHRKRAPLKSKTSIQTSAHNSHSTQLEKRAENAWRLSRSRTTSNLKRTVEMQKRRRRGNRTLRHSSHGRK